MGETIEIKTEQLVHEFVWIFNDKADIEIIKEIDSANYGIGFDLDVKGIPCRLYDESIINGIEFDNEDGCLKIEIDRLNSFTKEEQVNVANYLKDIITQSGFMGTFE
ncbi:MAG: hypothetical protein WAQ28_07935 [Bacteroidia bacterium]